MFIEFSLLFAMCILLGLKKQSFTPGANWNCAGVVFVHKERR
jgi:hypothetical protein